MTSKRSTTAVNIGTVAAAVAPDLSEYVRKDELAASPAVEQAARATETITQVLTPGPWVQIPLTNGSADNNPAEHRRCQMRLNAGRVELRGLFGVPTTTGYRANVFKIDNPEYQPEFETTQPLAVYEKGVAGRFGYIHVNPDGNATVQPQAEKWNRASLDGLWWPARGFTGPQTRPAPADD